MLKKWTVFFFSLICLIQVVVLVAIGRCTSLARHVYEVLLPAKPLPRMTVIAIRADMQALCIGACFLGILVVLHVIKAEEQTKLRLVTAFLCAELCWLVALTWAYLLPFACVNP